MTSQVAQDSRRPFAGQPPICRPPTRGRSVTAGVVLGLLGWLGASAVVAAAQLSAVSPQGEVARIRQVALRFDEPMVPLGDLQARAPATVSCTGTDTKGQGRWVDALNWVFDFERDLPPGASCATRIVAGLKSVAGQPFSGKTEYRFQTGGPTVVSARPGGGEVAEDQVFALRFNGAATAASVQAHAWCQAQGLGERIPTRTVDGKDRDAILQAIHWLPASYPAQSIHLLACQQRLPAGARMQLVLDAGIVTPSGLATRDPRRFDYTVREPFAATFSCERENAQAPCTPLRPITLGFSSAVSRKMAAQIVLRTEGGDRKPTLVDEDGGNSDANAKPADEGTVNSIRFAPPFPERAGVTIVLPSGFADDSGRTLENASLFPLKSAIGALPPLAKFSAAPFGVVERFGEVPPGKAAADYPALLPVTLRHVEADLNVRELPIGAGDPGSVSELRIDDDAAVLRWLGLVRRMHETSYTRNELDAVLAGRNPYSVKNPRNAPAIETRAVPLLRGVAGVHTLALPQPVANTKGDSKGDTKGEAKPAANAPPQPKPTRPFEVVGIPLPDPGFHVVEIASPRLGAALLGKAAPMYVRTAVLVTNLGVHLKLGRENAVAWVTTLDTGKPVAGATVVLRNCNGQQLAQAVTDASGIAKLPQRLEEGGPACDGNGLSGYFASARIGANHPQARGRADMAFVMSDWNRGIESWRFSVPTDSAVEPTVRMHTVLDRALFRAGETVSMKHFVRTETAAGFGVPGADAQLPDTVAVQHDGSGQTYTVPLTWRTTATGGRSAESTFAIPAGARFGSYEIILARGQQPLYSSGHIRVEAFRLPVLAGTLGAGQGKPLIGPKEIPVQLEVHYVAGGGAAGLPVKVSALLRDKPVSFPDYDDFEFSPPRAARDDAAGGPDNDEDDSAARGGADDSQKLIADKLPLTLDAQGAGRLTLRDLPALAALSGPKDLLLEAGFADPNGEIQTLRQTVPLWPADVVVGLRTERWVSANQSMTVHGLALDTAGKARAGVGIDVMARMRITTSVRKRVVGGFYRYDNHTEVRDLGKVGSGTTDSLGRMRCDVKLGQAGEVELVAQAKDSGGRLAQAAASVWVTQQGELWFGGENHDRIDLLPEKKNYAPGETASFQVRMPFRHATALLTVEREGIIESRVVELDGKDPTVKVPVKAEWSPNVYVSVLALRGRLRDVPWYSFFTWGWHQPGDWWRAFRSEGKEYVAPTPLVDLSKPAFRLGLAEIRVGDEAHRLDVKVTPDQARYPVRGKSQVTVQVTLPDGKPAANGEVALAAVDEALLELMPNESWDLLGAMLQRRAYGVRTSTAQMEIIGRRHYGRKAVPAGGGGGKSPTRELFDTLLLWNPRITLDAQGKATLTVPLNDALTRFRIVAVADLGAGRFGTGNATITATQDLQVISGLPPLVREQDRYRAMFTLRNTTGRTMTVSVTARTALLDGAREQPAPSALTPQTVEIPAGQARDIAWDAVAPLMPADAAAGATVQWLVSAFEQSKLPAGVQAGSDSIKVLQTVEAAVPVTVQQATLAQLAPVLSLPVSAPATALADGSGRARGGVQVALQSSLAGGLPGVREWFRVYPFACIEQRASKAVGMNDKALWDAMTAQLPAYLDDDGLASYFPADSASGGNTGDETLTAYLLVLADEAERAGLPFRLPDEARADMKRGLVDFVEGRIERKRWAPTKDLEVRKLAALEALSRSGDARPSMLGSIQILPMQWPTSALLDWISLLTRMPAIPQHDQRLAEAQQQLRARLMVQGTRLAFSTEAQDDWWWLMSGGDVNAARLVSLALTLPGWKEDVPKLAVGLLGRQTRGAWRTTNANALGLLAITRFARDYESAPVAGSTRVALTGDGSAARNLDWSKTPNATVTLPWPASAGAPVAGSASATVGTVNTASTTGSPATATLSVEHNGSGKPWATVRALAAVPLAQPLSAGYRVRRTVEPVEQAVKGKWTRGDIYRVTLEVDAQADMTWVVISDPVPGGATVLGSGLGRDSEIATRGEKQVGSWPTFVERTLSAYRAYYEMLPKGNIKVSYTVRLNNAGDFALPPTRVEVMYAPDVFGALPNARMTVGTRP